MCVFVIAHGLVVPPMHSIMGILVGESFFCQLLLHVALGADRVVLSLFGVARG